MTTNIPMNIKDMYCKYKAEAAQGQNLDEYIQLEVDSDGKTSKPNITYKKTTSFIHILST